MKTYNKNKRPLIAFALTTAVGLGMVGNINQVVAAGSDTLNLPVTASVATKCKLSNPVTVSFGAYDPVVDNASTPLDANGSFDVKCTKGGVGTLSIDDGANDASAVNTTRAMSDGGSNYLDYDLYTATGRTVVWDATNTVGYTAANANNFTETVYGRIPAGQIDAVAGSYSDTVVVTVSY